MKGVFGALLIVWLPALVQAQGRPAGPFEVSGGIRWTARMNTGGTDATETAANGSRSTLFGADTTLAPAIGFDAAVSFRLAPAVKVGVTTSFAGVDLETRIADDSEGIPDSRLTEQVTQFTVGADLVFELRKLTSSPRFLTFVEAGLGYLRHLHEGRTLVETGAIYHVGYGGDYLLKPGGQGAGNTLGFRFDLRAVLHKGGAALDEDVHAAPSVGAGIFLGF